MALETEIDTYGVDAPNLIGIDELALVGVEEVVRAEVDLAGVGGLVVDLEIDSLWCYDFMLAKRSFSITNAAF